MQINNPEGIFIKPPPYTIDELLRTANLEQAGTGKLLEFNSGDFDVYNITAPFEVGGRAYIAGRVESRSSHYKTDVYDPAVWFFTKSEGKSVWNKVENLPTFKLEDPFITSINGEVLFAGTKVSRHLIHSKHPWRMKFYAGPSLELLQPLAVGPVGMKDIRLLELKRGRIGVFTRPQGNKGGLGKIGFTTISDLRELSKAAILNAPIIQSLFADGVEYGGVNNAYPLLGDRIGILGHIARIRDGFYEYYAFTCVFDPNSDAVINQKIIVGYQNFPKAEAKTPQLARVVFPGGLEFHNNGLADLYCGVGDAHGGLISVPDPFESMHAR